MEKVDIYNNKHENLGYKKERKELSANEYRLSCFSWIMNDKEEILVQQRLATARTCPNMWETASGGAQENESSIDCIKRELKEELGIEVDMDNLSFIGSYARINDFVEVFLLKSNIDASKLVLQKEEVQQAKWMKIEEFEQLIKKGDASDTGFFIFREYYNKFYNTYVVFEDGKPVFKKI